MTTKTKEVAVLVETKLNRTVEGLTELAQDFLMEAYGLELNIPIKINGRLTKSHGGYVTDLKDKPLYIDIAKRAVMYAHDDSVMNTLKHECIHYAMQMLGKNNNDGHPVFEAELIKQGAGRICETMNIGETFVYECKCCGRKYNMNKKMKSHDEYTCHCDGELALHKHYISDGFNIIKVIFGHDDSTANKKAVVKKVKSEYKFEVGQSVEMTWGMLGGKGLIIVKAYKQDGKVVYDVKLADGSRKMKYTTDEASLISK